MLYEACLDRMQIMIEERDQLDAEVPANKQLQHPALDHFRKILLDVDRHPNRKYFSYKSIIINNLYGADIMEEATAICKLRLFLKLVSQVDKFDDIEPLPDIDVNIRAGNTLVGFASFEETKKAIEGKATGKGTTRDEVAFQNQMIFDDRLERIEQKAQEIERAFNDFRKLQTQLQLEAIDLTENKQHIRNKLEVLVTSNYRRFYFSSLLFIFRHLAINEANFLIYLIHVFVSSFTKSHPTLKMYLLQLI